MLTWSIAVCTRGLGAACDSNSVPNSVRSDSKLPDTVDEKTRVKLIKSSENTKKTGKMIVDHYNLKVSMIFEHVRYLHIQEKQ